MLDYAAFDGAVGLNWYEVDPNLSFLMDRYLEPGDREWAEEKLVRAGELCGGPIARRADATDRDGPELIRYDRRGDEVGCVEHNAGVAATKRDLYENYLAFEFSESARGRADLPPAPLMTAISYMLSQAETGMLCAIGMTSGVAALVAAHGGPEARKALLPRLRAERYDNFWDGAMFMTERAGGSDVGATETVASHIEGERWRLNGFKWFCSNVDADVIATLARPDGAPEGSRGLALFALPARKDDGSPNGLHIHRLKDKLGTRAVPTGEVELIDAEAYLLAGDPSADGEILPDSAFDGRGLVRMMSMVNGSRHGVAVMGLGIGRRSFLESAIYGAQRRAFGAQIDAFPLVRETLVRMAMEVEAAAALVFEASAALQAGDRLLWRILVPLAKYRATRRGLQLASAAVEVFGGNGYIEDWPAARQLRDAQCHTIWEGTENIICLDVRRASVGESAHKVLLDRLDEALGRSSEHAVLKEPRETLVRMLPEARDAVELLAHAPKDLAQLHTRRLARLLADVSQGSLLVEEAAFELDRSGSARKAALARLFCRVRFGERAMHGIPGVDRTVLDLFEPITGYGEIAPEAVLAASA